MNEFWKTDPLAKVALDAVRQGAKLCQRVQGRLVSGPLIKEDDSPVTIADFGSQALICHRLNQAFPTLPIVAEEDAVELRRSENAAVLQAIHEQMSEIGEQVLDPGDLCDRIDLGRPEHQAGRFWTLDPIDGTKGFLRGGHYAVALALIDHGQVSLGIMACPNFLVSGQEQGEHQDDARGVVFLASRGQGAFALPMDPSRDDPPRRLRVSLLSQPGQARYCERIEGKARTKDETAAIAQELGLTAPPLRLDSQGKYAVVARGDVEFYVRSPGRTDYREKIWDHASGVLLLEEAGGRVTDLHGVPLDFAAGVTLANNHGIIASNGLFHERIVAAANLAAKSH